MTPNPACLKAVAIQIEEAQKHLLTAAKLLRTNGYSESADDFMRSVRPLLVWTQRDGWLDALARKPIEAAE